MKLANKDNTQIKVQENGKLQNKQPTCTETETQYQPLIE